MIIARALMLLKFYVVHIMTIILFIFINVHLSCAGSAENYFRIVLVAWEKLPSIKSGLVGKVIERIKLTHFELVFSVLCSSFGRLKFIANLIRLKLKL